LNGVVLWYLCKFEDSSSIPGRSGQRLKH